MPFSIQPRQGIVGIKTAIAVKPKRAEAHIQNLITEEQFQEGIKKCTTCNECAFVCPPHIRISKLIGDAVKGDMTTFSNTYEICVGCGKCEQVCPQGINILDLFEYANRQVCQGSEVQDEIRTWARSRH